MEKTNTKEKCERKRRIKDTKISKRTEIDGKCGKFAIQIEAEHGVKEKGYNGPVFSNYIVRSY
jgi:hypothetical protein